ncbi:MAG: M28 family metallopeptidase [Bryobacterales bacterium]
MRPQLQSLALAAFLLAAACGGSPEPASESSAGDRWWRHIEFLASDDMKGRETGSPEHHKAAEYVAGQFQELGLKEAGTSGYLQPLDLVTRRLIEDESSLSLVRDGKETPLTLGEQAVLRQVGDSGQPLEAEMVFVGYGMQVPELEYDDFAGLDTKGKILVMLQGAPPEIPGALASHYQSSDESRKRFERSGAIAYVYIPNPRLTEIPWERAAEFRFQTSMDLADPALAIGLPTAKASVRVNPEHAEMLFDSSGHSFEEILALDREKKPLPKFALPGKLRAKVTLEQANATSENVVAILPGTDPDLADEYVLLSAHLDHIGVGKPVNGDTINNGAMDNASGVATLIEVARALREGEAPRRSVLLLACTGEEKGLLGSRYYSERPTVEMGQVVANVNLDMFLPIVPLTVARGYGLDESDIADRLRAAASPMGVAVQPDPEPERNIFIRSDQYNFIRKGVPALFLGFGYEADSPEEKVFDEWFHTRYHSPSDDLEQPVDKEAAAKFNELMLTLTRELANDEARPQWREDSFFRRFAAGAQ